MLTEEENFAGLARINRELIGRVGAVDSPQRVVLDMDSTEIPVYRQQEQSAYNGHFESTCYNPLLLFNRDGDCPGAKLRPGNVHSADDWPVVRYKGFLYQAASWTKARRVVAKVEFHFGELFPRVGFIVTNLETDSRGVVRFYNKRGRGEQWIKEGKQAVRMTRLSCHRSRSNEVRLWLTVMAYNLGNLWRGVPSGPGAAAEDRTWSLTSLQQRLVKTGGRLIKHPRYFWLLLAESHLTRPLFGAMLRRGPVGTAALPVPAG